MYTFKLPYLDEGSLRMLVQALVISQIYCFNPLFVWLPLGLIWRLQWVQYVVDRLVVGVGQI